jgi:serine protease Do
MKTPRLRTACLAVFSAMILPLGFGSPLGLLTASAGEHLTSTSSERFTPVVKAIRRAEPSVVNIQGNKLVKSEGRRSNTKETVHGMGTGIIIDSRGYIVTNLHVVQDVLRIEVTLHDGTETVARLINYDPDTDLALIKVPESASLRPIEIGTSHDLMRGESVIAIGNPYGYQHSVTVGIISALHRDVPVNGTQEYRDLIQTNADINPGNSGGPLVNIEGEMIGINVAVRMGAQGIGFAIPIDNALKVIAELVSASGSEELNLGVETEDAQIGSMSALRVVAASSTTALQTDDVVKTVAGREIATRLDLELALLGHKPGQHVSAEIERAGSTESVDLVISGESKSGERFAATALSAWKELGVKLVQVSADSLKESDETWTGGLRITEIRQGSPAARSLLQPGDVLVGIMRWQTPTMNELAWVLNSSDFNKANDASIHVVRGSTTYNAQLANLSTRR